MSSSESVESRMANMTIHSGTTATSQAGTEDPLNHRYWDTTPSEVQDYIERASPAQVDADLENAASGAGDFQFPYNPQSETSNDQNSTSG